MFTLAQALQSADLLRTVVEMDEEMGFRLSRLDEAFLNGLTASSGMLTVT